MTRRSGLWAGWLLVIVAAAVGQGCKGKAEQADPDTQALSDLVYNLVDFSSDPARFAAQFTDSARPSPAERRKYGDSFLKLAQPPTIQGDKATLEVIVTQGDRERTVQWTAVREAGQWKLSSAPLEEKDEG